MNVNELFERVWNYSNDIADGTIKACKKHKLAVKRFFDDMDLIDSKWINRKGKEEDYPYYFDVNELKDFYDWARMFKHVEGVIAGQPIELTDFQLFVVANIFCWKKKKNGSRRFKRVYIQLARKQGKSQLQALIASYVGFLSNQKEQIYIAGITKEQSSIVYDQILDQIKEADFLKRKYKNSYGRITVNKNNSVIRPLSKEAKKTGDGKFPSLNIIDEYHAHVTSEIFDVLLSGMIGRRNALHVVITTAGLDLNAPAYREYEYVSKILDPANIATYHDEYFIMICELDKEDDIKDESVWIKANPIVCTYEEGIEDLRDRLLAALGNPEKMDEFLTKHMNIWVQRKQGGYMDLEKWNDCGLKEDEKLPDMTGKDVYIGVDLSATLDLTSCSFIVPMDDGKFVVLGHSFLPEDTVTAKSKTDNFAYQTYERQDWLTFTEGSVVDYRYLEKYIIEQVAHYGWKPKGFFYDEYFAQDLANRMADQGYITVKVVQGYKTLAPATKDFRERVYQKKIIHDNNPIINWAFGNAMMKIDPQGNIMLDKSKSVKRIDPVACIMNANAHARFHYQQGTLDYSEEYLDKLGW